MVEEDVMVSSIELPAPNDFYLLRTYDLEVEQEVAVEMTRPSNMMLYEQVVPSCPFSCNICFHRSKAAHLQVSR